MGFLNFREKKGHEPKKKTSNVKKQIMHILSPKAAGADYFANPKKKKSNRHPKKKSMNKK